MTLGAMFLPILIVSVPLFIVYFCKKKPKSEDNPPPYRDSNNTPQVAAHDSLGQPYHRLSQRAPMYVMYNSPDGRSVLMPAGETPYMANSNQYPSGQYHIT